MSPLPVIIDTDPGLGEIGSVIDDGLAIAVALASPELDVIGLTVVNGNVDVATAYVLARRLLEKLDRADVPLHLGAETPMRQDMATVWQTFRSEQTGETRVAGPELDNVPRDAVPWLVQQVAERPREITIAALGPLTNIAEAIQHDPTFASNVREIVIMGGNATGIVANGVPVLADFNIFVDPEAADIVLRSGIAVRMIGIDQTSRVMLAAEDTRSLRARDRGAGTAAWFADCIDSWIAQPVASGEKAHEGFCLLHDPLVIAVLVDPDLCDFAARSVTVDLARGELLRADGAESSSLSAAVDTDVPSVRALVLERLAAI